MTFPSRHASLQKKTFQCQKTIIIRSQFTSEFGKVREEALELMEKEDNMYKCEGIVTLLTGHYLGLFPLWSGIFLGNMEQYASESKKQPQPITQDCKRSRQTTEELTEEQWAKRLATPKKSKY